MAVALTIVDQLALPRGILATFTLVFTANYPATGEPLNFQTAGVKTSKTPKRVFCSGIAGYVYQWDRALQRMKVKCNTAGGADLGLAEHSTGAYNAAVTGDTVEGFAIFDKLI